MVPLKEIYFNRTIGSLSSKGRKNLNHYFNDIKYSTFQYGQVNSIGNYHYRTKTTLGVSLISTDCKTKWQASILTYLLPLSLQFSFRLNPSLCSIRLSKYAVSKQRMYFTAEINEHAFSIFFPFYFYPVLSTSKRNPFTFPLKSLLLFLFDPVSLWLKIWMSFNLSLQTGEYRDISS